MAIGWMIKVDVTGDGNKDSVRGYAVCKSEDSRCAKRPSWYKHSIFRKAHA